MGNGKKKIDIKKIENLQSRNVCFSKRRKGLFKKASELSRLHPDIHIDVLVYSPAGKPYIYGDPIAAASSSLFAEPEPEPEPIAQDSVVVSEINRLVELDHSTMGLAELEKYANELKLQKMKFELSLIEEFNDDIVRDDA